MDTAPRRSSGKIALGVSLLVLAVVMVFVFARMLGQHPSPAEPVAAEDGAPVPVAAPVPEPASTPEAVMDRRLGAAPRGYPTTPDGPAMPMPMPETPASPPPMAAPGETSPENTNGADLGGVNDAAPK